jgi:N-carbamoyl-L-amino-acid hydrolase
MPTHTPANLTVNADRLWATVEHNATIGATPAGGISRLTLTDADREVRDYFAGLVQAAGYALTVDRLGNMFARREGSDPALPPVVIGSHLDSQFKAGAYDGPLGVFAGLEVLRTLDDHGIRTRRAIEVVNWTNEEGARFYPSMLCSLVVSGQESVEWAYDRRDKDGIRFGDALERIGYCGAAPVAGRAFDCYLELHIEQGPRLDAANIPVGIVTGGFAQRGMRIAVRGETAHVGPTPMMRRRNALVGAAHVIAAVDETGWRYAPEDGKSTAARLDLRPNLPGILSDEADLFIDFRHPVKARVTDMERDIESALPDAARRSGCTVEIAERWGFGGLTFDPDLVALVREGAALRGHATMDLLSEAGHDAYHMTRLCPTTMIFSPCVGGITHNLAERAEKAASIPAVEVLLHAALARAMR